MAENTIPFIIETIPPEPPHSAAALDRGIEVKSDVPTRKWNLPLDPKETFADAWKKIHASWDALYSEEERDFTYFTRLQSPLGVDIILSTTVGSLFSKDTPFKERTIYVPLRYIDRDSSIAPGSILQPAGFKRKLPEDLTPEKQAVWKRRRSEENRYGSALASLNADTPVQSRESLNNASEPERREGVGEETRVDKDGFKVPRKISRPQRSHTASRTTRTEEGGSQATILVEDSQPQDASGGVRSHSTFQQRRTASHQQAPNTFQTNSSSPTVEAAMRASTIGQGRRTPAKLARNHSTKRTSVDATGRQGTIPTPDSNEKGLSNNEAPTSAQQPRSAETSVSASSRRFIPLQHEAADQELFMDDPIEDDDMILVAEDYDVDQIRMSRGRTLSHSPDSPDKQLRLESSTASSQGANRLHQLGDLTAPDVPVGTPTTDPRSSNPLDLLRSSQGKSASKERTAAWTVDEDRQLMAGKSQGLSSSQIIDKYGFQRTEAALRNRTRMLQSKGEELLLSEDEDDIVELPSLPKSSQPSTQKKRRADKWEQHHISKLREALAYGCDGHEIKTAYFPERTEDGIRKKVGRLRESVAKLEMESSTYPKDATEIDGWSVEHNLKLRRTYFDPDVTEHEARKRWFPRFSIEVFEMKMKLYKEQMAALGFQADTGLSPTKVAAGDRNNAKYGPGTSSIRDPQRTKILGSQLYSSSLRDSSPSMLANLHAASSPTLAVTGARQRNADDQQTASFNPQSKQEIRGSSSRLRRQADSNSFRQTKLAFEVDKRKKRAGPSRPSFADIDAEFSRRSAHPSAEASTAGPSTERELSPVLSDRETQVAAEDSDYREDDGPTDLELLAAQIDSQSEEMPVPGLRPSPHDVSQSVNDSFLLEDFQEQSAADPALDNSPALDTATPSDPELTTTSNESLVTDKERMSVQTPNVVLKTPERPRSGRGGLRSVGGPATRYREREERHLREQRQDMISTSAARPHALDNATLGGEASPATRSLDASISGVVTPLSRRLPLGQASADSTTQSEAEAKAISEAEPVGDVEPWVPFEHRPQTPGGSINAGRKNFPYYLQLDNPLIQTEDEMYSKASRFAKSEWLHQVYERIKLENVRSLRMAAGDYEDLSILRQRELASRAQIRARMKLPPLQSRRMAPAGGKRRSKNSAKVGIVEDPEPEYYDPDSDEDDNLDIINMLKPGISRELLTKEREASMDSEEMYPNGVDHNRLFEEIVGAENPEPDAMVVDDMHVGESECIDEDDEMADRPANTDPAITTEAAQPSTTLGRSNSSPTAKQIHVYDETRCFVRTRSPLPEDSKSPTVQPMRFSTPVKQPVEQYAEKMRVLKSEKYHPISRLEVVESLPNDHSTVQNVVGEAERSPERMLAAARADDRNIVDGNMMARKRKHRSKKGASNGRTKRRDGLSQSPSTGDPPPIGADFDEELPQEPGRQAQSDSEEEDARVSKRAKTSNPGESISRKVHRTEIPDSVEEQETQSNYDRLIMPPPAITPQTVSCPSLDLQRQDSITSNLTSDTSSSHFGVRSDGSAPSKRSIRKAKQRRRRTLEKIHSDSLASESAPTTSPTQAQRAPDSEDDGRSPVTAPETQDTPEIKDSEGDSQALTMNPCEHPLQAARPPAAASQQSSYSLKSFTQRLQPFKQAIKWAPWIPPAPKVQEPPKVEPVKMPYGSDEESSSSGDSDVE